MTLEDWKDDRPEQSSLSIGGKERAEKETKLDRGASDDFADDRADVKRPDHGNQSALLTKTVEGQSDLFGETAEIEPEWSE